MPDRLCVYWSAPGILDALRTYGAADEAIAETGLNLLALLVFHSTSQQPLVDESDACAG